MRRVRMRSSGDRMNPVRTWEATGRRTDVEPREDSEGEKGENTDCKTEYTSGWRADVSALCTAVVSKPAERERRGGQRSVVTIETVERCVRRTFPQREPALRSEAREPLHHAPRSVCTPDWYDVLGLGPFFKDRLSDDVPMFICRTGRLRGLFGSRVREVGVVLIRRVAQLLIPTARGSCLTLMKRYWGAKDCVTTYLSLVVNDLRTRALD